MQLKPIIPFEPKSSDNVPQGNEWISQIKWDGVRILTYYDGKEVRQFNRKLNERTKHFPELIDVNSYCKAKSVILDGEVIALDKNGNPSFHEVMRRDGIRRMDRVTHVMKVVPVYYMIFDVIFYNGEWINNYPLEKRLDILSDIIIPNKYVQTVPIQQDNRTLFEVTKQHNLEGIVCKNLNSRYIIDGKTSDWQKVKNFKDLIGVIGGATYRGDVVNSIYIGLYDDQGKFWYVGHVGTGKLSKSDWKGLTKVIEELKIKSNPFVNEPDRQKDIQWLKPFLTVKVQYIEWPEGHTLRQPSIQAFVHQDPKECKLL
ncbi:MAG: dependent ligase [Bacillales bacterium]|jgi:bifunctional non-homologous end joining protein LigD|nr:dependent ligase [Bacillales bacterium]